MWCCRYEKVKMDKTILCRDCGGPSKCRGSDNFLCQPSPPPAKRLKKYITPLQSILIMLLLNFRNAKSIPKQQVVITTIREASHYIQVHTTLKWHRFYL